MPHSDPVLATDLAGIALRNPVIAAAGTCGYIGELSHVLDPHHLGALVTKSITREPREGNAPWRVIDVPHGMMNAIGLANVGLERFVSEKLPAAAQVDTVVIGSIAGDSIDDYVAVAAAFDAADALPIVELNVSCPNTDDGRLFGSDPALLGELVAGARAALTRTRMLVKLPPDAPDPVAAARAAVEAGADGLTLTNTMPALAIDPETRRPRLSRGTGGLSGPALHPVAVRIVHDVYRAFACEAGVPLVGLGGVMDWKSAAEFILAGASAVGMGTALFVDPRRPARVARDLARWVQRQGRSSVRDLVGAVEEPGPAEGGCT